MRRLSLAIAGLFVLVASSQAQAQTITFTAQLHGGNEVPVVVTGSVGTGDRDVEHRDARRAPTGSTSTTCRSRTTASHIHAGAVGVGGPVDRQLHRAGANAISNDFAVQRHASRCTDVVVRAPQGINSCEDFEQALMLGNTYVNVHSHRQSGRRNSRTADPAVSRSFYDRSTGVLRTFDERRTPRRT